MPAPQPALPTGTAAVLADWPKLAPDQFTTFCAALKRYGPSAPGDLAPPFHGATRGKAASILATLAALGQDRPGRLADAPQPAPARSRECRAKPAD